MKLLIVESPGKIKKIKSFLSGEWEVAASVGHIRDLPKKGLAIAKQQNYKMLYEINSDKQDVVTKLQSLVARAGKENVYLATDPDREGEAISYHLAVVLGLDYKTVHRVEFHEITAAAVQKAIAAPRKINIALVAAQQCRRAIDRLVGYEISPLLWNKVKGGMSAGRVQSVALRMITEKERQIEAFKFSSTFKVQGEFRTEKNEPLKATLDRDFPDAAQAEAYLLSTAPKHYHIEKIEAKPVNRTPPPPFTTSTLQQDAAKKLKIPVDMAMQVAQKLYEAGHITYMRTDSVNLSDEAKRQAAAQIIAHFGQEYAKERTFKSKEGAQEAHEAIRPTHFEHSRIEGTDLEQRLYRMIYARALASQMADAIFEQTLVTITDQVNEDIYKAKASVMKFAGYLAAYKDAEDDDKEKEEEQVLTGLRQGENLATERIRAKQTYKRPPLRHDEAGLVKTLEANGIGRPSTYAAILKGILQRDYVRKSNIEGTKVQALVLVFEKGNLAKSTAQEMIGGEKNKLVPTETGKAITAYLESFFEKVVDYEFTARLEEEFDRVAEGKAQFLPTVRTFDEQLGGLIKEAEAKTPDIARKSTVSAGTFEDKPIRIGKNERGVFIVHDSKFYNIEATDPATISEQQAIELIKAGREKKATDVVRQIGKTYQVKNGQYGLYVTDGKTNASLKSGVNVEKLTAAECKELIKSKKEWQKQQATEKKKGE